MRNLCGSTRYRPTPSLTAATGTVVPAQMGDSSTTMAPGYHLKTPCTRITSQWVQPAPNQCKLPPAYPKHLGLRAALLAMFPIGGSRIRAPTVAPGLAASLIMAPDRLTLTGTGEVHTMAHAPRGTNSPCHGIVLLGTPPRIMDMSLPTPMAAGKAHIWAHPDPPAHLAVLAVVVPPDQAPKLAAFPVDLLALPDLDHVALDLADPLPILRAAPCPHVPFPANLG